MYIFGLNYDKEAGKYSTHNETDKANKSHLAFKEKNLQYTDGMTSDIVTAYRNFIENWEPEKEEENPNLLRIANNYQNASFCFALDGHPEIKLHDMDGEICQKFLAELDNCDEVTEENICSITGVYGETARIHDKIKGVRGAKTTGASIVCYNSPAEESYGKSRSYNSGISKETMKRYIKTINELLADQQHRMYIDDITIIFWAMEKGDSKETSIFMQVLNNSGSGLDAGKTEQAIENAVRELSVGRAVSLDGLDINEDVEFYVAGLTPNASRISQKFIYHDKFGRMFKNVLSHQADMVIDGGRTNIPLWRVMKELLSPKSSKEKVSPVIASSVLRAALCGGKYPEALLSTAVQRAKTDESLGQNYTKAGIIKACLNRKARIYKKEELKVGLDVENKNAAYLCGRLFAVLERIQKNATKKAFGSVKSEKGDSKKALNKTIKETYFSSACSRPALVFPRLMKLAQYHLQKDDYAVYDNKLIGEIMDKLGTEFPQNLSLDEQGKFVIGYYHQYQSFFRKKNNDYETEESNN